jgi:hypothetical protein
MWHTQRWRGSSNKNMCHKLEFEGLIGRRCKLHFDRIAKDRSGNDLQGLSLEAGLISRFFRKTSNPKINPNQNV